MREYNNIKLLNSSYEKTPDIFTKRCINCHKLIYIKKSSINAIITCPHCKINMTAKINMSKLIKLKRIDNDHLIILYDDIMKNNDEYFLKVIADLPELFGKPCPECAKYIYFKKEHINSTIKCSNCNIIFKMEINMFKAIKLERVDADLLIKQELAELNASQEDTGSAPRFY